MQKLQHVCDDVLLPAGFQQKLGVSQCWVVHYPSRSRCLQHIPELRRMQQLVGLMQHYQRVLVQLVQPQVEVGPVKLPARVKRDESSRYSYKILFGMMGSYSSQVPLGVPLCCVSLNDLIRRQPYQSECHTTMKSHLLNVATTNRSRLMKKSSQSTSARSMPLDSASDGVLYRKFFSSLGMNLTIVGAIMI